MELPRDTTVVSSRMNVLDENYNRKIIISSSIIIDIAYYIVPVNRPLRYRVSERLGAQPGGPQKVMELKPYNS